MEVGALFLLGLYFAFISVVWVFISIFGDKETKAGWKREVSGIWGFINWLVVAIMLLWYTVYGI